RREIIVKNILLCGFVCNIIDGIIILHMKNTLIFIMLFIFSASIISLVFKLAVPVPESQKPVACTMEAKMCPDGVTYVGRTGPKCEFEACPKVTGTKTKATTTQSTKSTADIT